MDYLVGDIGPDSRDVTMVGTVNSAGSSSTYTVLYRVPLGGGFLQLQDLCPRLERRNLL